MRQNSFAPPELFAVVTVTASARSAQGGVGLSIATFVGGQRTRWDSTGQADPLNTGIAGTSSITASSTSLVPFNKTPAAAPVLFDRMTRRAVKSAESKTSTDGPAVHEQSAGLAGLLSLQ